MDKDEEIKKLNEEIKSLKTQMEISRKESEKTTKEKNEYLQNIAHQITSPLNNVKLSIESLSDEDVPFERKQVLLRSIYSQSTILVHLVKSFALMSDLEAKHSLEAFREKVNVLDPKLLMINLSNDFQPLASDRKIEVKVDDSTFDRYGEKRMIVAIKNLIDQVLSNILHNAAKYADENSRIISSMRLVDNFSVICITSRGLPINAEDQKHIFERGFRGKGAKDRLPAGTGYGLYIAKKIMEMHEGKLELITDGPKTTFEVWIPRDKFKK